jgi:hypothetical protein
MDNYLKNITFWAEQTLTREEIQSCTSLVLPEVGISDVKYADRSVSVEYNPYLISEEEITGLFKRLNIEFSDAPKKTGFIKRWLLNMVKENNESFGNQGIHCCSMNTKSKKR